MTEEERKIKIKEFITLLDQAIEMGKELNILLDGWEEELEKVFLRKLKERQEQI